MKTIYVKKGKEYHSVIECIYQEDLFFKDIYRRARDCTEEILQINEQLFRREEDSYMDPCKGSDASSCADASRHTKRERLVSNRFSNVIAFCANRGQGKTSVMLSYSTALSNLSFRYCRDIKNSRDAFWEDRKAKDARYEVLNSIDPTGMEAEDSILKIVLSQMFAHFQEADQCRNRKSARCTGNGWEKDSFRLQQKFLNCFHLANLLSADKKRTPPTNMEDELEFIAETGGGMNLRTKLYELIDEYLNFVMPDSQCQKYLVIPIDDADLDVGRVYGLLEDIRKYLQLPRVIILLATNITQLESIVEQHFFKEYEKSLSLQGSMVDVDRCHQISERYLEKILPGTRRLYLPNLNDEIKNRFNSLCISYLNDAGDDLLKAPNREEKAEKTENFQDSNNEQWGYQEQLLNYLHRKTGLFFVAPQEGLHDLLPSNMRELMHFLLYFSAMEDVTANYKTIKDYIFNVDKKRNRETLTELRQWRENLKRFQTYLLEIWSASNLRTESRNVLVELSRCSGRLMHQYLLQVLPGYYARECAQRSKGGEEVDTYRQQFINECAQFGAYSVDSEENHMDYSNDCYADVLTALRVLEEFSQGNREQKFIYAIRLYYSIHMHQMLIANLNQLYDGPYYLTNFLGDGLFKEGKYEDGLLPFTLCYFSVPSNVVIQLIKESPSKTQQTHSYFSTWFRRLVQERHRESVCHISWNNLVDYHRDEIWVFSPLYYLLAEADNLTSRYRFDIDEAYLRKQYSTDSSAEARMTFALIVLLNGEVQDAFRQALKISDVEDETLRERIVNPYNMTRMAQLWDLLERFNGNFSDLCNRQKFFRRELFANIIGGEFDSIMYLRSFHPLGMESIQKEQEKLENILTDFLNVDIQDAPNYIRTFNRMLQCIFALGKQLETLETLAYAEFDKSRANKIKNYISKWILAPIDKIFGSAKAVVNDDEEITSAIAALATHKKQSNNEEQLEKQIEKITNNITKVLYNYYYDQPLARNSRTQSENHTQKSKKQVGKELPISPRDEANAGNMPEQNMEDSMTQSEGKQFVTYFLQEFGQKLAEELAGQIKGSPRLSDDQKNNVVKSEPDTLPDADGQKQKDTVDSVPEDEKKEDTSF